MFTLIYEQLADDINEIAGKIEQVIADLQSSESESDCGRPVSFERQFILDRLLSLLRGHRCQFGIADHRYRLSHHPLA